MPIFSKEVQPHPCLQPEILTYGICPREKRVFVQFSRRITPLAREKISNLIRRFVPQLEKISYDISFQFESPPLFDEDPTDHFDPSAALNKLAIFIPLDWHNKAWSPYTELTEELCQVYDHITEDAERENQSLPSVNEC